MAVTRNIKDLPQTDAMTAGDYFLIEAPAGTQLLAFENFVIDEDNTTFATDLLTNMTTLSTQVTAVSADMDLTGANAAAKLYLVNTQLSERIDSMQEVLYGSDFESQINEFIASNPADPITTDDRGLDGNLKALSAMIFDELFARVNTLSATMVGDDNLGGHIQNRDLIYSGGDAATNVSRNDGGLMGVLLDTVKKTVDVNLTETSTVFNSGNPDSASLSFVIPSRYIVNRGSLQYNIEYTNEANISSISTGVNPYSQPGQFVTVGFNETPGSGDSVQYTWTVRRVGGAPFLDDEFPIKLNGRVVSGV